MRSIQDVGTEILSRNPKSFYIFCGNEYGIKCKYLQMLKDFYNGFVEAESVSDVLNIMRTKHIFPLLPTLYIVRYDENFIQSISEKTSSEIHNTKIAGTIVCLYEQPKHCTKVDKYLGDYAVSMDTVSPQFIKKYLHSDFPNLPDMLIDIAISSSANYNQAQNICRSMQSVSAEDLCKLTSDEIAKLFGYVKVSEESQIKIGVASRNFVYLNDVISNYDKDVDSVLYAILSTMLELDKLLDNSRVQSLLKDYVNRWTREDIYYMFMHTYNELQRLRSSTIYDPKSILIYLIGLLQYGRIPSLEAMS